MSEIPRPSAVESFWQRKVMTVIVGQLKQGITPEKVSLTIALGLCLGIFPILGATTVLSLLAGILLRLNQPIIQLVNWLASPLQLGLILVFVRVGEWLLRAPPVAFSVPEMFRKFHVSPSQFLREFGLTGLHGILGWLVISPMLAGSIYLVLMPPMRKLSGLIHPSKPV